MENDLSNEIAMILQRVENIEHLLLGGHVTPWLTLEEAARYLRCGKRKIEELLASGKLPYVRLDPSLKKSPKLIHRKHLAAFLLTGKNSESDHLTAKEQRLVEELQ